MLETLDIFRAGLADKKFTLTDVSKASGIPLTTLVQMRSEDWQYRTFDKIEAVADALDKLASAEASQ